ncbi:UbiA prenyltransferase family-domain-containing protein [Usnea florida]
MPPRKQKVEKIHKPPKRWPSYLPSLCVPYVELARLVSPAPVFLVFFPHLFGTLHAASLLGSDSSQLLKTNFTLFLGSFFYSNAAHVWNDLIDAPLDCHVSRTAQRPIPRGAVSKPAATIFAATQSLAAAAFLVPIPPACALVALPAIIGAGIYPFAKRVTYYPQVVLGLILAWGFVMGEVAMGLYPFESAEITASVGCLFLASTLWTIIYDFIYAHQDLDDDIKAGIKSMAVLYQQSAKNLLWSILATLLCLLIAGGMLSGMGPVYFVSSVVGTVMSLGLMIQKVQLERPESCMWWFGNGFWSAGGAMSIGLFGQYMSKIGIMQKYIR